MSAVLQQLRRHGLRLAAEGQRLVATPRAALTEELRAIIGRNRPAILASLAAEQEQLPHLAEFRHALRDGSLVVCANCQHFDLSTGPGTAGQCGRYAVQAGPFVPFPCAGFAPSDAAALPDFLPERNTRT